MSGGLVIERSVERGGVHALIVGIDDYPHLTRSPFQFPRLTSAAVSAMAIHDWLVNSAQLVVPLATCRLLLSPGPDFDPKSMPAGAAPATTDEFLKAAWEWRAAASTNADAVTLFFFCGHRLQISREEDIFLFRNFGEPFGPTFRGAVSFVNLFNGMEAHENPIARTQLYFLDGSRHEYTRATLGERLHGTTDVFDVVPSGPDRRIAGVFNAAAPGEQSWTFPGEASFFTAAIIKGFEGAAATYDRSSGSRQKEWAVTLGSLASWMSVETEELAARHKAPVSFRANLIGDGIVARLVTAPQFPVQIEVVPAAAAAGADITVEDARGNLVAQFPMPKSRMELSAGIYSVTVRYDGLRRSSKQLVEVASPRHLVFDLS